VIGVAALAAAVAYVALLVRTHRSAAVRQGAA
jgi:hypothetical protein